MINFKLKTNNNKTEFSKALLIQESALIWVLTLSTIVLAFFCVIQGYAGSLPWLTAMVGLPWTAYGVSQIFYYKKSMKENTKDGIKFESIMAEVNSRYGSTIKYNFSETDLNMPSQEIIEEPDIIIPEQDYQPDINYGI